MHLYNNNKNVKSTFKLGLSDNDIDKVIITFICILSGSVLVIAIIESIFACKEIKNQRKDAYRTEARAPKGGKREYDYEEEKWKGGTVEVMKREMAASGMRVVDFDDIKPGKSNESVISRNTLAPMGDIEELKEQADFEDPKIKTNMPASANLMINKLKMTNRNKNIQSDTSGFELAKSKSDNEF